MNGHGMSEQGMKVYISGPMSGTTDLNFPAFFAMETRLQALGYTVLNPASVLIEDGCWSGYMRADIALLMQADGIVMLRGWANSRGARLEHMIASELGFLVFSEDDFVQVTEAGGEMHL